MPVDAMIDSLHGKKCHMPFQENQQKIYRRTLTFKASSLDDYHIIR